LNIASNFYHLYRSVAVLVVTRPYLQKSLNDAALNCASASCAGSIDGQANPWMRRVSWPAWANASPQAWLSMWAWIANGRRARSRFRDRRGVCSSPRHAPLRFLLPSHTGAALLIGLKHGWPGSVDARHQSPALPRC
jgi:hypothetical protein